MTETRQKTNVIGAIFPVLAKDASNLFEGSRDTFVKFTNFSLPDGSRIVFYVSCQKLLVGEGRVRHVAKLDPADAWTRYKGRLQLDREDYDKYARFSPVSKEPRKLKMITVIELDNLRRYRKPVRAFSSMTPSGHYLTKEQLAAIRNAK